MFSQEELKQMLLIEAHRKREEEEALCSQIKNERLVPPRQPRA